MIARWLTNPLLIRAINRPDKDTQTIKSELRYGFRASFFTAVLAMWLFIGGEDSGEIRAFLGIFAVIILAMLPYLAYSAAVTTVDTRNNLPLDLLHVTALSDQRLVEGYILISLYRLEDSFAYVVGFTPLMLLVLAVITLFDCEFPPVCSPPNLLEIWMALAGLTYYAFNVIGIGLLMTVVGVLLAVGLGNRTLSSLSALLIGLGMTPLMVWAATGKAELLYARNLLMLPITYGLFGTMVWRARLHVRKAD